MARLAGNYGVLLVAAAVAGVFAASAIYLSTLGSAGRAEDLLSPGAYDTFEEAERATGFRIPHPNLEGWSAQRIQVIGPEYGIIRGDSNGPALGDLRIAEFTYQGAHANASIRFDVYRGDSGSLPGPRQDAAVRETMVGSQRAVLLEQAVSGRDARLVTVAWLDGDVVIQANAFLFQPVVEAGRTVVPGFTYEELLAVLNSVD